MREINVREIENVVKQLCIDANYYISDDIKDALNKFKEEEPFMIAEDVLDKILLNADIAANGLYFYRSWTRCSFCWGIT